MQKRKIDTAFKARHCRFCGKKLPRLYRYFCPRPEDRIGVEAEPRESCVEMFMNSYEGSSKEGIFHELESCVSQEELHDLEILGYLDFVNNAGRPKHPLCLSCPEPCKVAAPAPGTPTELICRKTRPELFEGFKEALL